MKIVYIHGFASSGNSLKYNKLKKMYPNLDIISPDLDTNPKNAINQLTDIIHHSNDKIILIGTSLGGFYTIYLSTKFDIPSFIINPVTDLSVMENKIGNNQHLDTGELFSFTRENFEFIKGLETEIILSIKNSYYYNIVVGGKDEILKFDKIKDLIPLWRTYTVFPEETHRFDNIELIKPLLDDYIREINKNSDVSAFPEI